MRHFLNSSPEPEKPGAHKKARKETLYESASRERERLCPSGAEFAFNNQRIRVLSGTGIKEVKPGCSGVVYWMSRDQRVQDNWALLYAQQIAIKNSLPLSICFCVAPKFLNATMRRFRFMLRGLREVEEEAKQLAISFYLLVGEAADVLAEFVDSHSIGCVIADFSPLRTSKNSCRGLCDRLADWHVPIVQVDAHNIVPVWTVSDKQESGARTIRKKIHRHLPVFLTGFPPVVRHPVPAPQFARSRSVDWDMLESSLEVDRNVGDCSFVRPGTRAAFDTLETFCRERLGEFGATRNNPTVDGLSNMSPYFNFGQMSVQRAILVITRAKSSHRESVDVFVEEAVVRRELSDNFCYYNPNYDNLRGASAWARNTLDAHRGDKREFVYALEELETARTHDELWNASQRQMTRDGKMHGFMRMYWAKKILEWTESPEQALQFAIYLNDKYELDGKDPNGYVGCMWSICGVHDQGWAERPVFGKIRYMNYKGCQRKFDVNQYISRYRE